MTHESVTLPGYEGLYTISRDGHVFSVPRLITIGNGARRFLERHRMAEFPGNTYGHLSVSLTGHDGRTQRLWIHRLVAETFIPNPENLPMVLHGPGGRTDNRVENLRWGTAADNYADQIAHGTLPVRQPRTHCRNGHEMTEENTYVPPGRPRETYCNECRAAAAARANRRKTESGVRRKPRTQPPARPCIECGNDFRPARRNDAVYCSAACKSAHHRKDAKC